MARANEAVSGGPDGAEEMVIPSPAAATPMIRQYLELKAEHPDAVLFFRLGDFYEMFFEDAQRGAELLGITLTARSKGPDKIPMAGVPYHSARRYIAKLISHGLRVAICEQVEAPGSGPGIVRREITRVITPGMVLDEEVLDARENNFLAAVSGGEGGYGAALLDGSTGEFHALSAPTPDALFEELSRAAPRELLIPAGLEEAPWIQRLLTQLPGPPAKAVMEKSAFETSRAKSYLCRHLEVGSLEGFGLGEAPRAVAAAGAALRYLKDTQRSDARHVDRIQVLQPGHTLRIDEATRANLELVRSLKDGSRQGTLISVVDRTATGMGGRKLARWLLSPLRALPEISARQDAISDLVGKGVVREALSGVLRGVGDIERLCGRVATGVGNARDLRQLADSLLRLPELAQALEQREAAMLKGLAQPLLAVRELGLALDAAVAEEPPVTLKEGGLIRPGYHAELDTLVELSTSGKDHLARIEARERARTGISSLKVRYNKVFGYFLEVTRANLHLVPEGYERKQTTVNSERFVTPELKDYEEKVLTAEERRGELEYALFGELCARVIADAGALRAVADAVATADALLSLARVAAEHGYVRPTVEDSDVLEIEGGRHPVVERALPSGERFVPNDVRLDGGDRQILVITGPNMAGKSTVMRQVALITLLAQVGSFVPAKRARIGLCDRIFTRVGAADDLARGRSTFMVEMTETANILHHATARSLVILDEIGRGTSTFDGLSIAWAVAEYIHDHAGARTLFATHYHELTELAERRPRVKNASVAVHEVDGRIVFLRKLVDGGTSHSYGIEVARLAGLPREVVARARELLAELEAHNPERGSRGLSLPPRPRDEGAQLGLFVAEPAPRLDPSLAAIVERLRAVSVNDTTPMAALQLLAELRGSLPPEA